MSNENTVMYVPDIAKRLHRSTRFIYKLAKRGSIPNLLFIGGRWAMSTKSFDNWIDGGATTATNIKGS